MGKQGPCTHCGATTTPLWRNGPPDKPILCNACGSRWRTRGSLEGYLPLNAGGHGVAGNGKQKAKRATKPPTPTPRPISPSPVLLRRAPDNRPPKHPTFQNFPSQLKRKGRGEAPRDPSTQFYMSDEDEPSALPGSRPTYSSSPGADDWEPSDDDMEPEGEDGPGPASLGSKKGSGAGAGRPMGRSASTGMLLTCSSSMPTPAPRKRFSHSHSRTGRRNMAPFPVPGGSFSPSPQPFSFLSSPGGLGGREGGSEGELNSPPEEYEEDDLMVHNVSHMISTEVGRGSLVAGTPSWDNMEGSGASLHHFFSYREERKAIHRVPSVGSLRLGEKGSSQRSLGMASSRTGNWEMMERYPYSKRDVLHSPSSPLAHVQIQDVVNCDNFYLLLSAEERVGLLQMLSPVDIQHGQMSVSELFQSEQFSSALLSFHQLLKCGMFDSTPSPFPSIVVSSTTCDDIADDSKQVLDLFQKATSPLFTNLVQSQWWMEYSALRERVELKMKRAQEERKKMEPFMPSKFGENPFNLQQQQQQHATYAANFGGFVSSSRSGSSGVCTANPFLGKLPQVSQFSTVSVNGGFGFEAPSEGRREASGEAGRLFFESVESSAMSEAIQGFVSSE